MPSDLTGAMEARLDADASRATRERQERHEAAEVVAREREAREARWEALDDKERLRLGLVAHHRGMDPRDLMDRKNNGGEQS